MLLAAHVRQHQRPQVRAHVPHEHLHLAPHAHHPVDHLQRTGGVRADEPVREVEQEAPVRRAQHAQNERLRQPRAVLLRVAQAHVHDRPRVAHAALGRAGDARKRRVLRRNALLLHRNPHARDDLVHRNAVEVEALAAGEDRRGELLRLRRRQDEHDVGRRLLQRLEQRVERARREHVHLVDDVDAVAAHLRRVLHLLAQVADLIDAVVARRVDLQDVKAALLRERAARRALPAGIAVFRVLAVHRAGEHLRRGRLARAARAAEQIRMRDAPAHHLRAQRLDHCLLSHKILKPRRTVAAVQRLIAHVSASISC